MSIAAMMIATIAVMASGAQATTLSRVLASAGPVGIRGGHENRSSGLGTEPSGVFCCTAGSPVTVWPTRRLRRCGSGSWVVRCAHAGTAPSDE